MSKRALFALALVVGFAATALANVYAAQPRPNLNRLAQASTAIVRGRVTAQETHWNVQRTGSLTSTTVAVDQVFKGSPGPTLVLTQSVGYVGNAPAPSSPALLQQGGDYLLFLQAAHQAAGTFALVPGVESAYRIYRDPADGMERVVLRPAEPAWGSSAAVPAATLPLREFQDELTTALEGVVVIPARTALPVLIESTTFNGVGRLQVLGRTISDVSPNPSTVIPAGSVLEGDARMVSGSWRILWSDVSVRGRHIGIHASNWESGGNLRGRSLLVTVK